jgi:WD40 repeat protein
MLRALFRFPRRALPLVCGLALAAAWGLAPAGAQQAPGKAPQHGKLRLTFGDRVYTGAVRALAYSPDGKYLATGGGNPDQPGQVHIYLAETGKHLKTIRTAREVRTVAYSPDGKLLAFGGLDREVTVHNLDTGKDVVFKTANLSILALAFSPDGKTLAAAGYCLDGPSPIELFDVKTGKVAATLVGHEGEVSSLAFSPHGKLLAAGGMGVVANGLPVTPTAGYVRLWTVADGRLRGNFKKDFAGLVDCLAFSPDGKTLALAWSEVTYDGKLTAETLLLDVASGEERARTRGEEHVAHCLAFSPDGQTLATGSVDGTVRLWDVNCGKIRARLVERTGWDSRISCLAFSPDGRTLAAASQGEGKVRLWEVK